MYPNLEPHHPVHEITGLHYWSRRARYSVRQTLRYHIHCTVRTSAAYHVNWYLRTFQSFPGRIQRNHPRAHNTRREEILAEGKLLVDHHSCPRCIAGFECGLERRSYRVYYPDDSGEELVIGESGSSTKTAGIESLVRLVISTSTHV